MLTDRCKRMVILGIKLVGCSLQLENLLVPHGLKAIYSEHKPGMLESYVTFEVYCMMQKVQAGAAIRCTLMSMLFKTKTYLERTRKKIISVVFGDLVLVDPHLRSCGSIKVFHVWISHMVLSTLRKRLVFLRYFGDYFAKSVDCNSYPLKPMINCVSAYSLARFINSHPDGWRLGHLAYARDQKGK